MEDFFKYSRQWFDCLGHCLCWKDLYVEKHSRLLAGDVRVGLFILVIVCWKYKGNINFLQAVEYTALAEKRSRKNSSCKTKYGAETPVKVKGFGLGALADMEAFPRAGGG